MADSLPSGPGEEKEKEKEKEDGELDKSSAGRRGPRSEGEGKRRNLSGEEPPPTRTPLARSCCTAVPFASLQMYFSITLHPLAPSSVAAGSTRGLCLVHLEPICGCTWRKGRGGGGGGAGLGLLVLSVSNSCTPQNASSSCCGIALAEACVQGFVQGEHTHTHARAMESTRFWFVPCAGCPHRGGEGVHGFKRSEASRSKGWLN